MKKLNFFIITIAPIFMNLNAGENNNGAQLFIPAPISHRSLPTQSANSQRVTTADVTNIISNKDGHKKIVNPQTGQIITAASLNDPHASGNSEAKNRLQKKLAALQAAKATKKA